MVFCQSRFVAASLSLSLALLAGCSTSTPAATTTPVAPVAPVLVPTVGTVTPAKLTAGAAGFTLTVNGTNFIAASAVQVGTVIEPTMYVSATQLTATVPASQLASGALLPVLVLNGNASSAAGPVTNVEVDNPSPTISTFFPTTVTTGAQATLLSVTGTGFVPSTVIQINGTTRSTSFVSATQVNVLVMASDLSAPGTLSVLAVNAAPGGGMSAAASVPVNNPAPTLTSESQTTVFTGSTTPVTITLTGTGFVSNSTVLVNTLARATTYISPTQVSFVVTPADQANAGRLNLQVMNPAPGGGTSNGLALTVTTPTPSPVITSVNPTSFIVGSPGTTVLVNGTNLTQASTIQWNGTALSTFNTINLNTGAISLQATVPASLLTTAGTASITVTSPSAMQPLSNAVTVTIVNPPAPTLTSLNPNAGPIGTVTNLTINGTGFTTASTVMLNGTVIPSTNVSSSSLTVSLPASAVPTPGNYSFTVTTPAPGGGTTAPALFSAYIPLVSNSMVYNPVDGLLYASVPGSVGAPMGNSIVSVNPATGAMGTPIFVGSEPNKLTLTADGKFLWVSLDGSISVRKVDLVNKVAGLQFAVAQSNNGVYATPGTITALAALPGATDSVIVSTSVASGPAIYDSGVARGTPPTTSSYNTSGVAYALQVDPTRSEVYAAGPSYITYLYSSAGLTTKATNTPVTATASSVLDEAQLLGGKLYTDQGKVDDAESGALLGTLYLSGSTSTGSSTPAAAIGPTLADTTLGKIFVLDSNSGFSSSGYNQIQVFKTADYTSVGSPILVNVPSSLNGSNFNVGATRLFRWGANGLTFHTPSAIYSLTSNAVVDLSGTAADLGVTLTSAGTATGSNSTYTAKVLNAGPASATDVVLSAQAPALGQLVSVTASQGTCSTAPGITCSLGTLANGASATVTITVLPTTAGTYTAAVQVSGSTTDATQANNSATSSLVVTGSDYALAPTLTSLTPAAIISGSTDTTITITGSGFTAGSTASLGGSALATTYVSATSLKAIVPAASLKTLGWAPLSITTATPGGGTSGVLPLSIYSVLTAGINHIVYDPFSRQIIASVGSGSSTTTGNSLAPITPETATIETAVSIGSQPTNLALSSDGQILYTILSGSQSVARFNMLTRQADYTYTPTANNSFAGGIALRGVAVQPGTENTVNLDLASFTGNAIYDFNPAAKTATIRGQASGPYSGSCGSFLDATNFLAFDTDTSGSTLDHYTVTASGYTYYNYNQYSQSTLNHFGCFKLNGGLAFANAGGIANPATSPALQIATLPGAFNSGGFSTSQALAPDTSLQQAFYPGGNVVGSYPYTADGFASYDLRTYLLSGNTSLNMAATEGVGSSYTQVDMIRWGQDGLAILTSGGHIYLVRGATVVPQLLNVNKAATLVAASPVAVTHGAGNTLLTLTGSNFIPGVAVTWNGGYRTTTIVDATHVTVAIPASDLTAVGTGSLVATNPGAPASTPIVVVVN